MRDGDAALQILTEGKLDPQARIVLLRLLGGVANHLDLPIQQAWYDRQLAVLEAQHPPPPCANLLIQGQAPTILSG